MTPELPENLEEGERLEKAATAAPWSDKYGFNNGGVPTHFFKIPGHNKGAEVEMLAEDSALIVWARNNLANLFKILREYDRAVGFWKLQTKAAGEEIKRLFAATGLGEDPSEYSRKHGLNTPIPLAIELIRNLRIQAGQLSASREIRNTKATLKAHDQGWYEGHDLNKSDWNTVWSVGATPRDAIEALCKARWDGTIEGELEALAGNAELEWGYRFVSDDGTGFKAAGIYVPGGVILTWWK